MLNISKRTMLGVCYGILALFIAILHNVFLLYHVEMFVSIYKIDKTSFWLGETIFLIWNSFNDPFFGWLSDRKSLDLKSDQSSTDIVLKRLLHLRLYGPLFGISFMLFWFSWSFPALQFVVCLCLYDGFLTMMDLHHSALLADMAVSAETRANLNYYCSFFSALGSVSVFLSYVVWNSNTMVPFQAFCAILTVISISGFVITTKVMKEMYTKIHKFEMGQEMQVTPSLQPNEDDWSTQKASLKSFVKQLKSHQNFVWFSCMNIIQVFHCHFNSNFFPLFLHSLLGETITPTTASVLLGISFIAPHINNLYFLTLCKKYGVYNIIKFLFVLKMVLGFIMFGLGPNFPWILCFFIASNRVFTEGTCKLLNLVISDLVDEDYVLHNRKQAVSALMYGTAALLSKPGQTLAPLIGTWVLAAQTGHDIFQTGNEIGSIKLAHTSMSSHEKEVHRQGCFTILVAVPIICAILQLLAWSQFTLQGKRLRWIKSLRDSAHFHTV